MLSACLKTISTGKPLCWYIVSDTLDRTKPSQSGLLHCLGEAGLGRCGFPGSYAGKQLADEFHLPSNGWLLVMDVAAFDSCGRLNPAQGRFS